MKQESYATLAQVKAGKLQIDDRSHLEAALKHFPDGLVVVEIKTSRPSRSAQQNRYWHGVVIPLFAEHCGYDFAEMKDALALELLPTECVDLKTGEVKLIAGHTSALNVKQFNDLIERAQRLGAEMGINIPSPNEEAA